MNLYLMVLWLNPSEYDPSVLYHEINADHLEMRRVEYFADGRLLRDDEIDDDSVVSLSLVAFPELDEMLAQPDFKTTVIDKAVFESVWSRAKQA
jgi:hypothetical protein